MNGVIDGKLVRKLRREREMTLEQLSEASAVDSRTISDIEHLRNRKPSFDKVVGLARALGVESEVLWPVAIVDSQSDSAVSSDPVTTRDLSEVP